MQFMLMNMRNNLDYLELHKQQDTADEYRVEKKEETVLTVNQ